VAQLERGRAVRCPRGTDDAAPIETHRRIAAATKVGRERELEIERPVEPERA
jgi:hypothetical protein